MGRPQLGFPRLRFAVGRATAIAIGPDHTPLWVTVQQNLVKWRANGFAPSVFNWRKFPITVRRERHWTTAGDKPARELDRSTGRNRSGGGGNKTAGASGVEGRIRRLGESAGRNVSER